jgi:predicted nucleic acid-binding Zn ribbon protein
MLSSRKFRRLRRLDDQTAAPLVTPLLTTLLRMNPSLRAAVIAEWRGLPQKKLRPDRLQSSAELMPKLMQRLGLRERLRESEVIDAWSKIVGDFIAAHSAPVALREGVLYVRVLQPALHYELEQISKPEILRKLKQRFGGKTIRDIRFRVG